jgi:hypothetical protein
VIFEYRHIVVSLQAYDWPIIYNGISHLSSRLARSGFVLQKRFTD